jgi:hypothetical protein
VDREPLAQHGRHLVALLGSGQGDDENARGVEGRDPVAFQAHRALVEHAHEGADQGRGRIRRPPTSTVPPSASASSPGASTRSRA